MNRTLQSRELPIDLQGEHVVLLPERALFWPRTVTLFIADLHWGKDAAFRAVKVPIPEGGLADDLARLDRILARTGACRLALLGDLLHASASRTPALIAQVSAWRATHPALDILLVRGNHDSFAGDPPPEWKIRCVETPHRIMPFALSHFPEVYTDGYTLAGHLHPGAILFGAGRQSLTLPCFLFGPKVGILPAFGSFTGIKPIKVREQDRVYVIAEQEVLAV